MKKSRNIALMIICIIIPVLILSSCLNTKYKTVIVVDKLTGEGDSFNRQAVDGINLAKDSFNISSEIKEANSDEDFSTILDDLKDNTNLVIGIGYKPEDSIIAAAQKHTNVEFITVDCVYNGELENVTGISYKVQESSFLVGYIAGMTTETNKVGFIGGVENETIIPFEYGYRAGVQYAASQLNKTITVEAVYIDSFIDSDLAKEKAMEFYSKDFDIIFQATGSAGVGVIDAATASGKYVIGVDEDQSFLAPENVLTSALKDVKSTVYDITENYSEGRKYCEKTKCFGLYEG